VRKYSSYSATASGVSKAVVPPIPTIPKLSVLSSRRRKKRFSKLILDSARNVQKSRLGNAGAPLISQDGSVA
jgi:hypothetical protein